MEEIKESIAQLQEQFYRQMNTFKADLQKSSAPVTTTTLAAEFASFQTFVCNALKALQDQVQVVARSVDGIEMQSRRKFLLFHGLAESKSEDVAAVVVRTVVEKMKVSDFSAISISRCHRMGRAPTADKPRPILVKIRDLQLRNKVWYAKTSLKGSGITLSEFLTKTRHDTFMAARQRFGISKCWTREGSVYVLGSDGTRHRVTCLSELEKIGVVVAAKSPKTVASTRDAAAAVPVRRRVAAVSRK